MGLALITRLRKVKRRCLFMWRSIRMESENIMAISPANRRERREYLVSKFAYNTIPLLFKIQEEECLNHLDISSLQPCWRL